jgi:hypothetical protein
VTINNQSGKEFENASLKFLAGDVHRIQEAYPQYAKSRLYAMAKEEAPAPPVVTERTFEEYHMYDLNRTTTLHNNQVKQVEFIRGMRVPVQKIYVYDGTSWGICPNSPGILSLAVYNGKLYGGGWEKIYVYDGTSWRKSHETHFGSGGRFRDRFWFAAGPQGRC